MVSLEFFSDSFRSHYGPGVDSASDRNEYQVYFLGVKGGRCVRLTTLPPSCAVVMKSGNLNFLEPSGPLQACNGTALPFNSWEGLRKATFPQDSQHLGQYLNLGPPIHESSLLLKPNCRCSLFFEELFY